MMTNETLGQALANMAEAVMDSSAPCNHDAVASILCLLAGVVCLGDEVALENVCYEWSRQQYPEVHARWEADRERVN